VDAKDVLNGHEAIVPNEFVSVTAPDGRYMAWQIRDRLSVFDTLLLLLLSLFSAGPCSFA
jgi:hypothetical protein